MYLVLVPKMRPVFVEIILVLVPPKMKICVILVPLKIKMKTMRLVPPTQAECWSKI